MSIHTCKTYQVEYAGAGVCGWDEIAKFLNWLYDKRTEGMDGIWISEDEEDIELDFDTLEQLKDDETWGKVIQSIIETADKRNGYARLAIF